MEVQKKADKRILNKKQKVLKFGKIFLVAMLFFTFFSKTINNLTLPQVVVDRAFAGNITKEIRFTGNVAPKKSINYYMDLRTLVTEVIVNAGDEVNKGDVILKLDSEALKEQLTDKEILLNIYENDYKKLKLDLEKLEKEDFFQLKQNLKKTELLLEQRESKYTSDLKLFEQGALSRRSFEESENSYLTAKIDYESQKEDLLQREENLEKDIESIKLNLENKGLNIEKTKNNINSIKKQIKDCVLLAESDGIVKEINFTEGMMTNNSKPIYRLYVISEGFQVVGNVTASESNFIEIGDEASISIEGKERVKLNRKVTKISNIEDKEKKQISIDIQQEGLKGGEKVEVTIEKDRGFYEVIVPRGAVYKDVKKGEEK